MSDVSSSAGQIYQHVIPMELLGYSVLELGII